MLKPDCVDIIFIMKNIMLTGSGGFVGKNLKEYFENSYNLLCPRSSELDLTDFQSVKNFFDKNNVDFIIHCATTGGVRGCADSETCESDNLAMVKNLLECKTKDTKIIAFGSGAAYSKDRDLHKIKEFMLGDVTPKDLYGRSKMKIAKLAASRNDMLCLNIFACYGKYEKETRFPTYAIVQNLKKDTIEINRNVIFDYLYIKDLCKIINIFMQKFPKNRVINVTPSKSISLFEIAEIVNNISDYKVPVVFKNPGMNFEYTGSNTVLLEEIPGFEFTPLNKGLKELYMYCKNLLQHC